ncbi:MAG: hypothetical protein R8K46_01080 [Mariprofundaceae bacterium]
MHQMIGIIASIFMLTGCATTHMQSYLGKDMRDVIADNGPPVKEIEVSETRRAFQYNWDYGTFGHSTTSYNLEPPGRNGKTAPKGFTVQYGYLIPNADMLTGHVALKPECAITFITEWNEALQKWIVVDYRGKNNLMC